MSTTTTPIDAPQADAAIRVSRLKRSVASGSINPTLARMSMSRADQKPVIGAMSCVSAVASASAGYDDAGLNPPPSSRSKNITFDDNTPHCSSAGAGSSPGKSRL